MIPFLRAGYGFAQAHLPKPGSGSYRKRLRSELGFYSACANVQDLPAIAHYWSNKFLVPMLRPLGFTNAIELVRPYILRTCRKSPGTLICCASLGCGHSQAEINIGQWLREQDCSNFLFECYDVNPDALRRGETLAREKDLQQHFRFDTFDINAWRPRRRYPIIVAFQSLHHVLELERLFETIRKTIGPAGYFLADDMIGRNGHQRWPEALRLVEELWIDLPKRYKYNHQIGRVIDPFENFDCSKEGFEGIRAQDILPLLVRNFQFEVFVGFGNIIDVFIDRGYGHNFDPAKSEDTDFIDKVHALDMKHLEFGTLKPTHLQAAMTTVARRRTAMYKHMSPEFCLRLP